MPRLSRRKRTRERRLRTPAGTVPRRHDTRPDTIGEVVDSRLDPRLDALACQMIAAEDDVDRLAPERAQRAERCVDDARVRARREHTDAAAGQRSSEVWELLGAVKSEFGKYADVLAKIKKLTEAQNTIDKAETRTRAIHRKLRDVESTDNVGLIEEEPIEEDASESQVFVGMGEDV